MADGNNSNVKPQFTADLGIQVTVLTLAHPITGCAD